MDANIYILDGAKKSRFASDSFPTFYSVSLRMKIWFSSPSYSLKFWTPWSVFQDGSMNDI